MRVLRRLLVAGLLVTTGLFTGCNGQPPRMKNQPAGVTSVETKIQLPGKKKALNAAD